MRGEFPKKITQRIPSSSHLISPRKPPPQKDRKLLESKLQHRKFRKKRTHTTPHLLHGNSDLGPNAITRKQGSRDDLLLLAVARERSARRAIAITPYRRCCAGRQEPTGQAREPAAWTQQRHGCGPTPKSQRQKQRHATQVRRRNGRAHSFNGDLSKRDCWLDCWCYCGVVERLAPLSDEGQLVSSLQRRRAACLLDVVARAWWSTHAGQGTEALKILTRTPPLLPLNLAEPVVQFGSPSSPPRAASKTTTTTLVDEYS